MKPNCGCDVYGEHEWITHMIPVINTATGAAYDKPGRTDCRKCGVLKPLEQFGAPAGVGEPAPPPATKAKCQRRECLCGHSISTHGTANGSPKCRFCACRRFDETNPAVARPALREPQPNLVYLLRFRAHFEMPEFADEESEPPNISWAELATLSRLLSDAADEIERLRAAAVPASPATQEQK